MTKYTIEYRRCVRTGPYESLTIGMTEECDTDDIEQDYALQNISRWVNNELRDELDALHAEATRKLRPK